MTILLRAKRGVVAALVVLAIVLQGTTSVLAGTTGSITGTVVDASTNRPVTGAHVTAASPSQTATTTTDAFGRYTFLSLTPDTYTVSVAESQSHAAYVVNGVTVQADQSLAVGLTQPPRLTVIGTVASRASSALVKPGTTADVYSINATTQDKASAFGGGGTLNSAWSAISSVPGVFVAPNQAGYIGAGPSVSIRGGDYDQIGYEFDGIPVNRAFDNYPSGPLSSLGQQEVQVYTGATPANSEAEGISGYINQVIKTGTAPAYRNLTLAIGTPTFYNKAAFETGGANPARTFSYYVGLGGYNQNYRYADNFNGASLSQYWGPPLAPCPDPTTVSRATVPSCFSPNGTPYTQYPNGTVNAFALGPFNTFSQSAVQDRDSIVNLRFGLPHKDGTKDDIQLLYDNNFVRNPYYISTNDQGGANYLNLIGLGTPSYVDGLGFNGAPVGTLLNAGYTGGGTTQYAYPGAGHVPGAAIPPNDEDAFVNNQSIVKLQYQKNFGTNAYLRLYGYTYYSNWLQYGTQTTYSDFVGDLPADYELSSHTRGVSLQFSDQITSQHLLSMQGSYTTSTTLRDNNTQMFNGFYTHPTTINPRTAIGVLVNGSNPYNGVCYNGQAQPVNCYNASGSGLNSGAQYITLLQAQNGTVPAASSFGTCGSGPCQYLVIGNGQYATYNTVVPKFYSASITDDWKPTDKLTVNYGLRLDVFQFYGSNTTGTPARTFFYNAWNSQFPNLQMVNTPSQIFTYPEWQPRFGATYSLNPSTALRLSYGRYAQAPNSAFEQYDYLQQEAPIGLANFVRYGIGNTPGHAIRPEVSNNYDFSLEHQFAGDVAIKLSPFLRKTQDQIQQFYLDQKTNFVSGLNVGQQTSKGLELEIDKGDFSRNGLAAKLSFTYTNSLIRYNREPNGQSVVDGINSSIQHYNSYTSACAAATATNANLCGGAYNGQATFGSVANPYYNTKPTPLLDPNGSYPTFDTFPGGFDVGYTSYGAPYIGTLLVQYKKGPLAITPALQFFGGQRYGVPQASNGVLPDTCSALLGATTVTGDPRYPVGGTGAPYDAASCTTGLAIPNPFNGQFDGIGAFVQPSQLQLHLQVSYDLNKRITLVGNFANLYTSCFGGTKVPWAVPGACSYTSTYGFNPPGQSAGYPQYVGNVYNPGDNIQPFLATPYDPLFKGFPFNMYFEARIKM
jgi:TonB dependent receptor/Carboxypeptidase regulatory-like domain